MVEVRGKLKTGFPPSRSGMMGDVSAGKQRSRQNTPIAAGNYAVSLEKEDAAKKRQRICNHI